tara:strand:- start:5486 stop:6271 length:786 start_codon:yes stop_codon:yes gene_type:complete
MKKNFTFVHTDFYSYYSHISKNKEVSVTKAIDLMLKELKILSDNRLIIPTYNYGFPKSKIYDYYNDHSQVGYFSELFREKFKNNRSYVPIFSDCSNLKDIKKFKPINPMAKNSTFDFLSKNNGKIVTFGSNFAPSFIMYVENCIQGGPRYRYIKKFTGVLKKKNIKKTAATRFYCRPLNIYFKYDLKKIEKDIKNNKILKYYKTDNQFEYSLFNAKKFKEYTLLKLQKDHFYFLDKKTKFIMKKFLKNKSRVEIKDFERNV